jgi:hypothetical protein
MIKDKLIKLIKISYSRFFHFYLNLQSKILMVYILTRNHLNYQKYLLQFNDILLKISFVNNSKMYRSTKRYFLLLI